MNFSPTYISSIVIVLVAIFNLLKINIKQEEIEPIITAIITAVAGIIVLVRRFKKGDITVLGARK